MFDRLSAPQSSARKSPLRPASLLLAGLALLATGCASNFTSTATGLNPSLRAIPMHGSVHGGEQPIAGATVTLYAVGATSTTTPVYGTGSTVLATSTTSTDGNGSFTLNMVTAPDGIATDYVCPSSNTLVYLVSVGGNTQGVGVTTSTNGAAVLMAALGQCGTSGALSVDLNEVSTAASVFALAQYINPGTSTPGTVTIGAPNTTQAQVGLANAFANVPLLETLATGTAVTSSTAANPAVATVANVVVTITPESAKLNHIANILAACVNQTTAAGANCGTLFANAVPPATAAITSQPNATFNAAVDTLQAAYYMAINPTDVATFVTSGNTSTTNLTNLYNLATPASPFQPGLTAVPTDWTMGIMFSAFSTTANTITACSNGAPFINYSYTNQVDAGGNIWLANGGGATNEATTQMGPQGQPLNCSGVINGSRGGAVIDINGKVWSTTNTSSTVYRFDPTANTTTAFTTTGKTYGMAADGSGNVFFSVVSPATLNKLASGAASGTTPTAIGSVTSGSPYDVAVDTRGTVFVSQSGSSGTSISYAALTTVGGTTYAAPKTLTSSTNFAGLYGLAVGANGNFYYSNSNGSSSSTDTGPGNTTGNIAVAYSTSTPGATVTVTPTPSAVTPVFAGGLQTGRKVAVDGAGNVWIANNNQDNPQAPTGTPSLYSVSEFSSSDVALSPTQVSSTTYQTGSPAATTYVQMGGYIKAPTFFNQPRGIAIDPSGNVWITQTASTGSSGSPAVYQPTATASILTELVGAAVPVVTPISAQLAGGTGPVKP